MTSVSAAAAQRNLRAGPRIRARCQLCIGTASIWQFNASGSGGGCIPRYSSYYGARGVSTLVDLHARTARTASNLHRTPIIRSGVIRKSLCRGPFWCLVAADRRSPPIEGGIGACHGTGSACRARAASRTDGCGDSDHNTGLHPIVQALACP